MTPDGVHPSDMFEDDPTIAAFARDLSGAAADVPSPVAGAALASVLEHGLAARRADVPAVRSPRRAGRLRWAVGGVVFGLGVGSLGVAGALPDPVQKQVSRVADVVGVHLPDGQDGPATTTSTTTAPTTVAHTPAEVSTTIVADDHGEGDDDSSDNGIGTGTGDDGSTSGAGSGDEGSGDDGAGVDPSDAPGSDVDPSDAPGSDVDPSGDDEAGVDPSEAPGSELGASDVGGSENLGSDDPVGSGASGGGDADREDPVTTTTAEADTAGSDS